MSRGRRSLILGGLALLIGSLAAADMAGRERALRESLGPLVPVVVAHSQIASGTTIGERSLALRRMPARYVPAGAFRDTAEVVGARAGVAIPAGADLQSALLAAAGEAAPPRPGERVARVVAVGAARELPPGSLADLLITTDGPGGEPRTRLALRGAEVISSAPAARSDSGDAAGLPRVALALRVTLAQAIEIVEAQNGARELRALPRP